MLKGSAMEKWKYKEHTKVKHIPLRKYLVAWISMPGRWNSKICYFDGFADREEYTDGTLGSPIITLEVADRLSEYFGELICFFIEKDPENFINLDMVSERENPKVQNSQKIKLSKENDEFANVINEIFEYLKEKSVLAPSFFFVDPFGFSKIPFTVIRKILKNPRDRSIFYFYGKRYSPFYSIAGIRRYL